MILFYITAFHWKRQRNEDERKGPGERPASNLAVGRTSKRKISDVIIVYFLPTKKSVGCLFLRSTPLICYKQHLDFIGSLEAYTFTIYFISSYLVRKDLNPLFWVLETIASSPSPRPTKILLSLPNSPILWLFANIPLNRCCIFTVMGISGILSFAVPCRLGEIKQERSTSKHQLSFHVRRLERRIHGRCSVNTHWINAEWRESDAKSEKEMQ